MIRSAFNKATSAVQAATTAVSDTATQAVDLGIKAKDAAVKAGTDTFDAVVDTGNSVANSVVDTKNSVVYAVVDAKNSVVDTVAVVADTVGTMTKSVLSFTVQLAVIAAGFGLIISVGTTAAVPALIGIFILDFMTTALLLRPDPLDEVGMRALKRKNGRLIEKLSRFGAIPETSLIETPNAKFRLSLKNGTISGTIKTGIFSSTDIDTLSDAQLDQFASTSDEETRSLIAAYLKFREAHRAA